MILLTLLALFAPDPGLEARALLGREAMLAEGVEALDRRIAALAIAQQGAQAQVKEAQAAMQGVAREAEVLSLRLEARRDQLTRRLVHHRALDERTWLRVLTDAGDVGRVLRQRYSLKRMLRADLAQMNALRADETQLGALLAERGRAEAAVARQRAALDSQRAALDHQRAVRTEVLEALQRERRLMQRALAEQSARRAGLDAELSALGGAVPTGFAAEQGQLPWPVQGPVRVPYGERRAQGEKTRVFSKGLTIEADAGTPARAVFAGQVAFADWYQGFGQLVIVDHGDRWFTLYAHLDTLAVDRGAAVQAGTIVGGVGNAGALGRPALYFEVRHAAETLDPGRWLRRRR